MELNKTDSTHNSVLARKWRPKNFSQVVGQETTVKALKHALKNNRLHHAYLFTGNRGVGKTTIARLVAKAVNCMSGEEKEPCTICKTCKEIDSGNFIDVIEIDAASNRGVEEIQRILDQTQYAPSIGLKKVIVIDEVHMLSNHAFNAMLKTLEEPPDHIIFILATTDPHKIPATVVSRCLQFVLRNISSQFIFTYLKEILTLEEIYFEQNALKEISLAADGSMRDALSVTDQALACGEGKIEEGTVIEMLGLVKRTAVDRLIMSIANSDAKSTLKQAEDLLNSGISASSVLVNLAKIFHKASVFLTLNDDSLTESDQSISYLCQKLNLETIQIYYQIVTLGRRDLSLSPDEFIGLEMTLIRLFTLVPKDISNSYRFLDKSKENEEKKNKTHSQKTHNQHKSSEIKNNLIGELTLDNWVNFARDFDVKGLLRQFFQQATLLEINKQKVITFKFLVPMLVLNEETLVERVEIFLSEKFKVRDLKIEVKVGDSPKKNLAEVEREILNVKKDDSERKILEYPLTKKIIKHFNAKIVRDSIQTKENKT